MLAIVPLRNLHCLKVERWSTLLSVSAYA